jgi:hypothetical protein
MNWTAKILALILVFLGGALLYLVYQSGKTDREVSSLSVDLHDAKKALAQHCREMTEQLAKEGIANSFAEVEYTLHEPKLKSEPILKDLPKCFSIEKKSSRIVEVAIFSSDALDGSKSDKVEDIQFQISVLDRATRNKIAEAAFHIGGAK